MPWHYGLNATTIEEDEMDDPLTLASDMMVGVVMISMVSMLQHLAIVKFYAPASAQTPASQEIVALGASQTAGAFFGSMPVTASFGRSAVNADSGAKTPMGGIVTGVVILASCAYLTPHFAYIPTAALAAVIIAAMIFTVDIDILLPMWKSKSKHIK